jgi:catechol 2,3-dioxygenase-like lactoylglutathione lyase family enzyme
MRRHVKRLGRGALVFVISGALASCHQPSQETTPVEEVRPVQFSESRNVIANNSFFYYGDLEAAWNFYTETLGFETVADYGFAKILRIAQTSYVTLVDAAFGMKSAQSPKTVALALVTSELDQWYEYLAGENVPVKGSGLRATDGSPHDGFVVVDPEGYYLEFERFNDHPENHLFTPILDGLESRYPSPDSATKRPPNLGIKATVLWLYSEDVHAMSRFYDTVMGFGLVVDQGWAMIHQSSPSGFIGPVDGARGMHSWTEDKAVMVSLLTTDIEGWFARLSEEQDFTIRDAEIGVESRAGARVFVGQDPDGYIIEFDEFFEAEGNETLLEALATAE